MYKLLAQIILAARDDNTEGWMNTLVVVLLVVFWAIGGLLKAKAKKAEAEKESGKEPFKPSAHPVTAKPVYSPSRIASAERGKARGVAVWRPQPQRIRAGAKTLAEEVEPRRAKPSVAGRKAQGPGAAVAKVASELPKKPVSASEEPTIEPLLSTEEQPDELRRAILHYEILGKPLSLREPDEKFR